MTQRIRYIIVPSFPAGRGCGILADVARKGGSVCFYRLTATRTPPVLMAPRTPAPWTAGLPRGTQESKTVAGRVMASQRSLNSPREGQRECKIFQRKEFVAISKISVHVSS